MSEKKTLVDEEIVTQDASMGRRSSLRMIGAGFLGAAVAAAVGIRPETAQAQGVTDSDSGPCADRAGAGRGASDSDSGRCEDPGGHGRGARCNGQTDSDGGPCADGAGHGRERPRH